MQFGRLSVMQVFFQNKDHKTIQFVAQGGGTVNNFELRAQDTNEDKHFF